MFLICGVDLVAPLARLPIQILPTGECAPSQKVVFNEPEWPFYTGRTIGIPNRMRYEPESETLSKCGHLGHRNHGPAGAAQHHHMRVIDPDASRRAGKVTECLGEEHLAVETLKRRVALKEQHPRVAQHPRRSLHLALLAGQLDFVRGRPERICKPDLMLQFLARLEAILARRHDRRLSDALLAAESRQRGIRQGRSASRQFLMEPDEIPRAGVQKLQNLGSVGFGFLGPRYLWHLGGVRSHYFAHRQTGDSQQSCNLVLPHSPGAQFQNRSAATWGKAQQTVHANFLFGKRSAKNQYRLRNLIKCGRCGLTYVGVATTGRTGSGSPTTIAVTARILPRSNSRTGGCQAKVVRRRPTGRAGLVGGGILPAQSRAGAPADSLRAGIGRGGLRPNQEADHAAGGATGAESDGAQPGGRIVPARPVDRSRPGRPDGRDRQGTDRAGVANCGAWRQDCGSRPHRREHQLPNRTVTWPRLACRRSGCQSPRRRSRFPRADSAAVRWRCHWKPPDCPFRSPSP